VPGLFVVDDLVNPSVAVNGVSPGLRGGTRIVRTMINGVEVNFRPDLTAFIGPEYIPMDAIERVEIAKGPLSALYGANAFLATVNVITRVPPTGTSAVAAGWATRLQGHSGFGASGSVGFNDGRKSLFASFVFDQLDRSGMGIQQTFPAQQYTPDLFTGRSRDDIRQSTGAFVSFRMNDDRLGAFTVQGGLQSFDTGTEFQINSLFSHTSRLGLYNAWSNALWERSWSRLLQTTASLGWSQGGPTRDTQLYLPDSRSVIFEPNYAYGALTGKLEVGLAPSRALSFAAGLDAEHDHERILYYTQIFNVAVGQNQSGDQVDVGIAPNEPHTVTVSNIGGYLKAGLAPLPERLPNLRLTGNLRTDVINQGPVSFPWQTSWRAAIADRFTPAISAKLIVGRAFQVPSAVLNFARPGYGTIGNIVGVANVPGAEPLRPQSVTSIQTAVTARLFGDFALEGEVYYQDVKDRIEFIRYGSNYRAANQGDAKQVGLAGILRFVHQPLSVYLGGNVLRDIVGGQLSDQPPSAFPGTTATLGGNLDLPRWNLRLNAETRYVGLRGASQANVVANNQRTYSLPAYTQTDLTLSINPRLLSAGTQTTVMVGVRNLFDVRFSEPGYGGFDIPALGRLVFVQVRQAF
jgi:outer membrane receptor protein involved in Fe transport